MTVLSLVRTASVEIGIALYSASTKLQVLCTPELQTTPHRRLLLFQKAKINREAVICKLYVFCIEEEKRSLATTVVILVDDNGTNHVVRAILDFGSECCFMASPNRS